LSERIMKKSRNSCAEKRKELQTGRGTVLNTNKQYHAN